MARTPVRRLIEKGIEAGADYIPDVIETPLRRAFSIDVPKPKASKPKASLVVTPKPKATFDLGSKGYKSAKVGDTTIEYAVGPSGVEVSKVFTPSEVRGRGSARTAMQSLVEAADREGLQLNLTPDPLDAATSKTKLQGFYSSLGFTPNKGRNKDFATRAAMLRAPQQPQDVKTTEMAVTPKTRTTPSKKPAEKKAFAAKGENYVDPPSTAIADWDWRALEDVRQDLGDLSAVSPEAIEFGKFMQEKNQQAMRGMEPRDLLKAYGITRSSIQRQARPLATAERGGLELGQLGLDMVRPEGAFSEWLGTPAGQAYLDAAQRGQVRTDALEDLQTKFSPFGFQNKLAEDLEWAAQNLPQESSRMSDLLISTPGEAGGIADYRDFIRDKVRGVAAPKAGFVGSMLGRGDLPTFDARQIILNTGRPTEEATSYLSRRKGAGGIEAVDRLASRLSALGLEIPPDLAPYYQHLAHHSVWDKASDEATTHADLMNAMRNYYAGGAVTKDKY